MSAAAAARCLAPPRVLAHRVSRHAAAAASSSSSSSSSSRERRERFDGALAEPRDGTLLMFSYGANLAASTLRARGVSPSASAIARAPRHALVFRHRGGYASLDEVGVDEEEEDEDTMSSSSSSSTGRVPRAFGVVHRISRSELALVRKWEIGYEMKSIDVLVRAPPPPRSDDAEEEEEASSWTWVEARATAFLTKRSARLRAPVPPFNEYGAKIVNGAVQVGLPDEYVEWLRGETAGGVPYNKRGDEYFDLERGGLFAGLNLYPNN